MIRVALADDQELVRAGFAALLDAEDDIEVVAEAADGEEAVRVAARSRPDVLFMDIRMPRLDGIEATRRIAASSGLGDVHIVILTTLSSTSTSSRACAPAPAAFSSRTPTPPS